jgi:hypothetical protein
VAETKTKTGRTSTEKSDIDDAKATETGVLSEEVSKARFVEKVSMGDFMFTLDHLRGLAVALGVEDELPASFFGRDEVSPTAGLTPATGSGGVPFEPEAASKETVAHAKAQKKLADDGELDEVAEADARRLAQATGVK